MHNLIYAIDGGLMHLVVTFNELPLSAKEFLYAQRILVQNDRIYGFG